MCRVYNIQQKLVLLAGMLYVSEGETPSGGNVGMSSFAEHLHAHKPI